jgi:5-methylcytosine-specific restriction endonuclease McrA
MSDESHESSSPLSYGEGPGVRSEKRCSKCGITKPLDTFSKLKKAKDGCRSDCKTCVAAYQLANAEAIRKYNAAYRAANADKLREQKHAYNAANAEAIREYNRAYKVANAEAIRAYRAANAEAIREYNAAYFAAHPEYGAAYRAANAEAIRERGRSYYANNVEARREYGAAYRAAHPEVNRTRQQRRRARKKGNGGSFTIQEFLHMQLVQGGECAYCMGLYHPHALTIDHIIPIAQGGRHEAANICLACEKCNKSKNNRTPDQWINRWYYQKSE